MSHAKERKEKNCLNCNAIVAGRFCQVCGQENIETHETFGHLATHFISDIFHFDGQFFSTLKYLLFRPGFLTYEYVRGRRASYLNPVKMFVFISAIFFLYYVSVYKPEINLGKEGKPNYTAAQVKDMLLSDIADLDSLKRKGGATVLFNGQVDKKKTEISEALSELEKDTTRKNEIYNRLEGPTFFGENIYDSEQQYDSLQKLLPEKDRDGWLTRRITLRNIQLTERYHEGRNEMVNGLVEAFEHHLPQMMFLSLPLFALVLQLLYVRHKLLFYVNHIIYAVHLYCAVYIFIFFVLVTGKLQSWLHLKFLQWVSNIIIVWAMYYSFRAMKIFYAQGAGKTLLKWMILSVSALLILLLLFIGLILFTIALF